MQEERMDGNRFDALSRSLAGRTSRRQTLRRLGAGGLGASLLGLTGRSRTAAQGDDETTCTLAVVATIAVGPDQDDVFEGELTMVIGADGAIDDGTFETTEGEDLSVVGQATGRALNLRITLANGNSLALTGTGQQDIVRCRGDLSGTFGGPRTGDLGTWTASLPEQSEEDSETPESGDSGSSDGSGAGGGDSGDDGENGGTDDGNGPNPTPCDPTGIDCGGTFVLDPATCQCGCPQPYDRCGDTCCFGGATCNADGSCQCPSGTEPCQEVCTPSCPTGQYLDPNTCQCTAETSCGQGETLCNGQCVSLACQPNQLFDNASCQCVNRCSPGQDYCNGTCILVTSDTANCGFCGNTCAPGVPCIAGTCECPFGYTYCASQQKCLTEGSTC
jgi:hypothetical protein